MQIVSIGDNLHEMLNPVSGKKKTRQHFMQIVFNGDNLHEMSDPVFWEK